MIGRVYATCAPRVRHVCASSWKCYFAAGCLFPLLVFKHQSRRELTFCTKDVIGYGENTTLVVLAPFAPD